MNVDAIFHPRELNTDVIADRAVAVFDVLRATTTIAAALDAGVSEIHIFGSLNHAKLAATAHGSNRLLCGEERCLPPEGFDLGNSPCAFRSEAYSGRTMFLATTNGTRAFLAARRAKLLIAGALVNAAAVARVLRAASLDVTLLCAGTDGGLSLEDVLGAGAVIESLAAYGDLTLQNDAARLAHGFFQCHQTTLLQTMRQTQGGLNIRAVNLDEDIAFAARLDVIDVVGRVRSATGDSLLLRSDKVEQACAH